MRRSTLISFVDVVSFAGFFLLLVTGAILWSTLPPGSGGLAGAGRGGGRPVHLLWGLTRHEWGDVHFWISTAFLCAMAAHLLIHWKWIRASFRGATPAGTRLRTGIGLGGLFGLLALAALILLGPRETISRAELQHLRALPAAAQE